MDYNSFYKNFDFVNIIKKAQNKYVKINFKEYFKRGTVI